MSWDDHFGVSVPTGLDPRKPCSDDPASASECHYLQPAVCCYPRQSEDVVDVLVRHGAISKQSFIATPALQRHTLLFRQGSNSARHSHVPATLRTIRRRGAFGVKGLQPLALRRTQSRVPTSMWLSSLRWPSTHRADVLPARAFHARRLGVSVSVCNPFAHTGLVEEFSRQACVTT